MRIIQVAVGAMMWNFKQV